MPSSLARQVWLALETLHACAYFAPEPADELKSVGLKGWWMGYFAARAAPMGPVQPGVVTATFHGFAPRMVERAVPDAWARANPADVLAARLAGVDQALRRTLGEEVDSPAVAEAVALARPIAEAGDPAGRPVFAAHASLPWPAEPHLALWHAATLVREHRGDGHVAALTSTGVDGVEAHVLQVARGAVLRERLQPTRGWDDDEWAAAEQRLHGRGWLDGGELTATGRAARDEVEATTDRLAAALLQDRDAAERLVDLAGPIADRVAATDVAYPNPIGLPRRAEG